VWQQGTGRGARRGGGGAHTQRAAAAAAAAAVHAAVRRSKARRVCDRALQSHPSSARRHITRPHSIPHTVTHRHTVTPESG
jgi:hypothetical protein